MDNVTDALYMAASVMIFVLALALSMRYFNQAADTAKFIYEATDRSKYFSQIDFEKMLDDRLRFNN